MEASAWLWLLPSLLSPRRPRQGQPTTPGAHDPDEEDEGEDTAAYVSHRRLVSQRLTQAETGMWQELFEDWQQDTDALANSTAPPLG